MLIYCHGDSAVRPYWILRRAYRQCSECGGVHPEDLARLLTRGATLTGAEWVGDPEFPYWFYVSNIKDVGRNPIPAAKFNTLHLLDLSTPVFEYLRDILVDRVHVFYKIEDGNLLCKAPRIGYQYHGPQNSALPTEDELQALRF